MRGDPPMSGRAFDTMYHRINAQSTVYRDPTAGTPDPPSPRL